MVELYSCHVALLLLYTVFYDNCRNSCTLFGWLSLSISGQTHDFIIYAMRQGARADNLTICYRKQQIDISFSWVCPVIDNEFCHNNVKVASLWILLAIALWIHSYFDNVMMKFMINNRTDAWKTDVIFVKFDIFSMRFSLFLERHWQFHWSETIILLYSETCI